MERRKDSNHTCNKENKKRTMSIYKKYQEYAISIVGRKNGYITQAEREKAKKKNRKKKKK